MGTVSGPHVCYYNRDTMGRKDDRDSTDDSPMLNRRSGNKWAPDIVKSLPWSAVLSVIGVVLLTFASAAVLKLSDGQPTADWPSVAVLMQPTVILAIISVLSNILLRYAMSEGWRITWWRKSLKEGTIADLHRNWAYGNSNLDSIKSGRHFNRISLAKLVTTLAVIQGPLLQRSSSSVLHRSSQAIEISASLSPSFLPFGFTGLSTSRAPVISLLTPQFLSAIQEFNRRSAIPLISSCTGVCTTQLKAAGFDTNCSESRQPYDFTWDAFMPGDSVPVFYANVTYNGLQNSHLITVATLYKPQSDCKSNFTVRVCQLREGVINYPVSISNGTVSLLPASTSQNYTVELQYDGRDTYGGGVFPSTIGGLALAAQGRYESSASLYMAGTVITVLTSSGPTLAQEYANMSSDAAGTCALAWDDPTPDILDGIRAMMFRAAITASNSTTTQIAQASEEIIQTGKYSSPFIVYKVLNFSFVFLSHSSRFTLGLGIAVQPNLPIKWTVLIAILQFTHPTTDILSPPSSLHC
jgi:hypothetical protein